MSRARPSHALSSPSTAHVFSILTLLPILPLSLPTLLRFPPFPPAQESAAASRHAGLAGRASALLAELFEREDEDGGGMGDVGLDEGGGDFGPLPPGVDLSVGPAFAFPFAGQGKNRPA